jgi:formate dehydrogenase maturation protein FdhE
MNRWQRRMERAAELAAASAEIAPLLNFYVEIARFQSAPPYDVAKLRDLIVRAAPAAPPETELEDFCARIIDQAEMEGRAGAAQVPAGVQPVCPFCTAKPVAAVHRTEGDGGKRFLLCGRCFTEWEFRRLLCPHCGEENQEKLPVFTADQVPHVRVEACDTCHVYLKAIDLTKYGLAVPEVDELATLALDLWAAEHGYTKLQTNLFGL